jgi:hypothetical protein
MFLDNQNGDDIVFITKNGEITLDKTTGIYTVWDETYADVVGDTKYLPIAEVMLETYKRVYLDGEQSTKEEKETEESGA